MTDETSPPSAEQSLADRYGPPRGRSGWLLVVIAAAATGLIGWLIWVAWFHATHEVSGGLHSFTVVSEHQLDVVLDIHREGTRPVECTVTALAEDHTAVGEDLVRLPAGAAGDHRLVASIRTDREATSAKVSNCV